TIRGTASNPQVGVNPLSVFTPAMFRDLFRRAPPARPSQGASQATPDAAASQEPQASTPQPGIRPKIEDDGGR
ncbi:MAG: hypothetical protein AAFN80_13205, partial [Pseudomonadota bacterium]